MTLSFQCISYNSRLNLGFIYSCGYGLLSHRHLPHISFYFYSYIHRFFSTHYKHYLREGIFSRIFPLREISEDKPLAKISHFTVIGLKNAGFRVNFSSSQREIEEIQAAVKMPQN